jgi:5-methylcytosine-specific restriction endonuclease McrA
MIFICDECGKLFIKKYDWSTGKNYCNKKCFFSSLKKRKLKTSIKNWNDIRKKVFNRDNYTCQICHKKFNKSKFIIHHIDNSYSFSYPGYANNKMSNLQTLCRNCHSRISKKIFIPFTIF